MGSGPDFLKEWRELDGAIREQFKKKLAERLDCPRVDSAKLSGMADCYKIKLKNAGYRLVYQVDDNRIVVVGPSASGTIWPFTAPVSPQTPSERLRIHQKPAPFTYQSTWFSAMPAASTIRPDKFQKSAEFKAFSLTLRLVFSKIPPM